jgi:PEGA domain
VLSRACLAVVIAACSSKTDDPPPAPPPSVITDAGVDGITAIVAFDPASGMHLDDDSGSGSAKAPRRPKIQGVPIGILLKSEPTQANVTVDGENLGVTPKYWSGVADGTEHVFSFTKANYALAHYKFVPITSGVVHATLVRVSSGETLDAGLDPISAPPPDATIAPPPTVLAPDAPRPSPDAAPIEPPADAAEASGPQP